MEISGFILLLPILIIRFGLLKLLNKEGTNRAIFTPPLKGIEKPAYWINILSILAMSIILLFSRISLISTLNIIGLTVSIIGIIFYGISIIQFAKPNENGLNIRGLYSLSRNPIYVAFFLYFVGCCLLTNSLLLFVVLVIFQISEHFLILSEERWCIEEFGEDYTNYKSKVRRYL